MCCTNVMRYSIARIQCVFDTPTSPPSFSLTLPLVRVCACVDVWLWVCFIGEGNKLKSSKRQLACVQVLHSPHAWNALGMFTHVHHLYHTSHTQLSVTNTSATLSRRSSTLNLSSKSHDITWDAACSHISTLPMTSP